MATVQEDKKVPFLKKEIKNDRVIFTLGNGNEVVVAIDEVSPENWNRAALHGISQRLGDACANLSKDKEFGAAFEVMMELKVQLSKAEWNRERDGQAAGRQLKEDLAEAMAKLKKLDIEVAKAAIERATPEKIKEWAANKAVAAEILDIKSKRAKKDAKAGNQTIDDIDLGIE